MTMNQTMWTLGPAVLAAVAMCAAGCSDPKELGNVDGGDTDSQVDPGDTDPGNGCAADQVVDGNGQCVDTCTTDNDCTGTDVCDQGLALCVPAAPANCDPNRCAPGYICPSDGGTECVPLPGYCGSDFDCNLGERCEDFRCVSRAGDVIMTCTADSDCGLLMTCQFGICVGCLDDLQCSLVEPGSQCVMGTCVVADIGPALDCLELTCPDGEQCNPATGQCEPVCAGDGDCDTGQICAPVLNQCVVDPGCAADEDCGEGLTCTSGPLLENGMCTGCTEVVPCKAGLACVLGACLPDVGGGSGACATAECAADQSCDSRDGSCYPTDGSCGSNADCREGHTCNSLIRLCSGCSVDGDCRAGQRCLLGTCAPF